MAKSGGSWKKGQCPNPGGRIGGLTEIRDKALTLSFKGLALLEKVIMDENESIRNRLLALNMAFDRGLGKPMQALQIEEAAGENNDISQMSRTQIEAFLHGSAEEMFKSYLDAHSPKHIALLLGGKAEGIISALYKTKGIKSFDNIPNQKNKGQ